MYTRVNWEDLPSTNTPINATNLNKMDKGIKDNYDEIQTKATLEDIQDNLVNVSNEVDEDYRVNFVKSKNLLPKIGTNTIAGLTATEQSDGSLILNGTVANSNFSYYYCGDDTNYQHFNALENGGTFTLSCNEATGYYIYVMIGGSVIASLTNGGSTTFTVQAGQTYRIFIRVSIGTTLNNVHIYPMLNEGSEELEYEPYITPSIYVDNEEIYSKDNLEQYSTNEVRIGTWIDGKPLYRKVIQTTMPTVSTDGTYVSKQVSIGSSISYCYVAKAIMEISGQYYTLPYLNNAGRIAKCFADLSSINLVANGTAFSNGNAIVVVEYTKATDTVSTRSIPVEEPEENSR